MRVLIVDDEKNIREAIAELLRQEGFDPQVTPDAEQAQARLKEEFFAAVVLDLRLPGMDGLELLRWLMTDGPATPVLMISAHGEIADAVGALQLGARDYLVKPFDPEELLIRLRTVIEDERRRHILRGLRDLSGPVLLGESPAMREIDALLSRLADTPTTVLITGESGTGKEVIARELHRRSNRSEGQFVAINVAALPRDLLESELFGHQKGAFTGADRAKQGLFEIASGGTILLDEIGEMPMDLQSKLLRVLQERRVRRVGGLSDIPVDARVLAATNRDLVNLVREGRFREDLYYRINVVPVRIPPLRERLDDLPLLAVQILKQINERLGRRFEGFEPGVLQRIKQQEYPGNVRELANTIERACIFANGPLLTARDFALPPVAEGPPAMNPPRPRAPVGDQGFDPDSADSADSSAGDKDRQPLDIHDGHHGPEAGPGNDQAVRPLRDLEKDAIVNALRSLGGNRTRAARALGISRRTLYNKLDEYGIRTGDDS